MLSADLCESVSSTHLMPVRARVRACVLVFIEFDHCCVPCVPCGTHSLFEPAINSYACISLALLRHLTVGLDRAAETGTGKFPLCLLLLLSLPLCVLGGMSFLPCSFLPPEEGGVRQEGQGDGYQMTWSRVSTCAFRNGENC